jgi:hypothetical protein
MELLHEKTLAENRCVVQTVGNMGPQRHPLPTCPSCDNVVARRCGNRMHLPPAWHPPVTQSMATFATELSASLWAAAYTRWTAIGVFPNSSSVPSFSAFPNVRADNFRTELGV